jgi:hypothetical protein
MKAESGVHTREVQHRPGHPGEEQQEEDERDGGDTGNEVEATGGQQNPGDRHDAVDEDAEAGAVRRTQVEKEAFVQERVFKGEKADDHKAEDQRHERRALGTKAEATREHSAGTAGLIGNMGTAPA